MKKRFVVLVAVTVMLLFAVVCSANPGNIHNPGEQIKDWNKALEFLEEGNERYLNEKTMVRNTNAEDRGILKSGQHPFAVVVTCADSRVAPEIYFDQKLGDIFVIRNAGNIADKTALGSIEYAVEHLHVPLVVVVGHSLCGAVAGAFGGGEFPDNLQSIISTISAGIKGSENVEKAIHTNIDVMCEQIRNNVIVKQEKATVIGAHYDIVTGAVTFKK